MAGDIGRIGLWVTSALWRRDDGVRTEAAAEAERLGFGAIWLGRASGDLDLAARLLGATERLVVATGIVSIWTVEAQALAAAYGRVAVEHPGRLLLGLGVSHAPAVESAGQRYARPYERMVEYLEELDTTAPPVPPLNRALAALGPRMLRLAADRTAGAHPYLTTPEHTRRAREVLGDGPLLVPEQKVVLEADAATARRIARGRVGPYLRMPNYIRNLHRLGFGDADLAGDGSDRLVDALVAWGDVDAVRARVAEHHQAGADHVAVQVVTGSDEPPIEQWRALGPALTS